MQHNFGVLSFWKINFHLEKIALSLWKECKITLNDKANSHYGPFQISNIIQGEVSTHL